MLRSTESWSTQQLVEFVAVVSDTTNEQDATQRAVERAAEAFEAEVCAVVRDGSVVAAIGFPVGGVPEAELAGVLDQGLNRLQLAELGELRITSVELEGERATGLLVGRLGCEPFSQEESDLLRGIARVLALTLRVVRTLGEERELRRRSQSEIRQRKRVERELAHQALHDGLTGLPNRSLLRDRAAHALDRAAGTSTLVAALFVDLDHFKLANDSLGHGRADELLIMLTERLETVLALEGDQRGHTLARLAGDEFVVLCEDLSHERDAITVAERIQDSLRAAFVVGEQAVSLTASIGIAIGGGEQSDADALLRDAGVAMSRAKERGRDRYEVYDEQMRVRLLDRVQLEADLRAGLERDELRLAYQPVVAISDGSLVAVEALVRWQHPTRGLLSPAEFIPLAEESDLIVALGQWVLEEACRQLARWRDSDPAKPSVRVSVNVSARQLTPALVDVVADVLSRTGVDASQLSLEITESLLIEQAESSGGILTVLRQLGVGIVLDDFGIGYSSLSYLKSFPLDQLKLDRSFISELARDPRSAKIVSATIDMARALGMTVVAEGVETPEQLGVLRRLGCDYAQGYYFARPQWPDEILARIKKAFDLDRGLAARGLANPASVALAHGGQEPGEDAEADRRVALGRMAAMLFVIGSLLAIPADLVLGAPSALVVTLLTVMGVASGVACYFVPWARISPHWLHLVAVIATIEVTIGVRAVGNHASVLATFYLLIATAVAYGVRERRPLVGYVLLLSGAMALPLAYLHHQPKDAAPRTIVSILILVVTVVVVASLRERMEAGHAELRELAASDALTGVGNYRLLNERLEYELAQHQRGHRPLAILLIDLDRFKQVNEQLGHAAGDDVLRRVASALRGSVRQQDTVARQGGDEFAVLAPETDTEGATMLAVRIRERLGRVQFAGQPIGATVGVAVYPSDGKSTEVLLACADARLLAGKTRSRNAEPAVDEARPARESSRTLVAARQA